MLQCVWNECVAVGLAAMFAGVCCSVSVLQCVAVCCSVLQCVAVSCSESKKRALQQYQPDA